MPIKILSIICLTILVACQQNVVEDFGSTIPEEQKDSIANQYNNWSNYFRQPSEPHRRYKDSALMVRPKNVEYRQVLSYSYKKKGEHIDAMRILNKATEVDLANNNTDALAYRIWSLLYYYRDYEGALRDIELIEKLTGKAYNVCWGEPCRFHKGQALYRLGRFEEAIVAFDSVLEEEKKLGFDPISNYMIYFYKGRCHFELGQYTEAIDNYDIALITDDSYTEAIFQKGRTYIAMKNFAEAENHLNNALFWAKKDKRMSEPYIERFDEVFPYMIEEELETLEHLN